MGVADGLSPQGKVGAKVRNSVESESEVGISGVCEVRRSEECQGLEGRFGNANSKLCPPFLVPDMTPVDRPKSGCVEPEVGFAGVCEVRRSEECQGLEGRVGNAMRPTLFTCYESSGQT